VRSWLLIHDETASWHIDLALDEVDMELESGG
jgi:hypothetical protein